METAGAEVLLERVSKRFRSVDRSAPSAPASEAGLRRWWRRAAPRADPAALDDVTLAVAPGECVAIVGPSGCGKSTTLRMVAGLEEPDAGRIAIAGKAMAGVPPQDRDVAMVFQGYALYPQMTAREIMEFPLKMRGAPRAEREAAVRSAAELLRIGGLLDRRPDQLSGGERQRVAMGRAIVRRPRVFLFDEPLSNLDAALRADIRVELGQLVRRLGATALYVTHDHVEAMTLGDRVAVMRAGRLLQLARPREVYEQPANAFVAAFIGSPRINLLAARVDGGSVVAGPFRLRRPPHALPDRFQVGARPEHVAIAVGRGVRGEVVAVEPLGAECHVVVRAGDHEVRARAAGFDTHRRGDVVGVSVDDDRVLFFRGDSEGGVRLT